MIKILIMAALVSSDVPPPPPGYVPPKTKLISPKAADLQSGSAMVKAAAIPAFVPPSGFVITNITVVNGQVSLAWQKGTNTGLFQAEGAIEPSGPWLAQGLPTTGNSSSFPASICHYWRVMATAAVQPPQTTWAKRLGGSGTDFGCVVTTDAIGNVLVAGVFEGSVDFGSGTPLASAGGYDVFLAKYTPTGTHLWSKRYGGVNSEVPKCIAQDSLGNIFLCGSLQGGSLMKLDALGTLLWTKGPVATGLQNVNFASIATDSAGNVIATGSFVAGFSTPMDFGDGHTLSSAFGSTDAFLAKYSPLGTCLFAKSFVNFGDTEYGTGVATDHSDNILLAGYAFAGIDLGGGDLENGGYGAYGYLAKFSPAGAHLWSRKTGDKAAGSPTAAFSRTRGISLDSNGDVAICGDWNYQADWGGGPVVASAPNANGFVAKYANGDGHYLWASIITGNLNITPTSMATDGQNNVVLTGVFKGTYNFGGQTITTTGQWDIDDCFVAKYSGSGSVVWAQHFGGTSGDNGNSIAVDLAGYPFVTGAFQGTGNFAGQTLVTAGGLDAFLIRVAP